MHTHIYRQKHTDMDIQRYRQSDINMNMSTYTHALSLTKKQIRHEHMQT